MTNITKLALLLIASGAVVMLISILKYNGTIRLANELLSADKKAIQRMEKIHRMLMCFFLGGYLVVFVSLITRLQIVGDIFTGMIFFFGAVFVFIGIVLQSNMLISIRQNHEEIVSKNNQLIQTENVTIFALAYQAEIRDRETEKHLERTCEYVRILAEGLSLLPKYRSYLTHDCIADIVKAAPLHDIGKVGIPDSILQKPGKLTAEEFEIIKKHCEYGANILRAAEKKLDFRSFLTIATKIIIAHHERWDGKGYPLGLKGEHFDPDVTEAFLRQEKEFLQISKTMAD